MDGIEAFPSPNFGPRRDGARADMVVLHYTGMETAEAARDRLCDSDAEVSAHYLICENGRVWSLVDEDMRAWHAGAASWGPVTDINSRSIGIEFANPGHEFGYPPFPEAQMRALEELLAGILARHTIRSERVVSHACVAPGRKRDPGEKFDWRRLALGGLAVWLDLAWLDPEAANGEGPDAARFQAAAQRFGYSAPETGDWCAETLALWQAFAMRFLPADLGAPTARGVAHLERLAERWPCAPEA